MTRWEYEPLILERKERAGDRSRRRLSMPNESPEKQYAGGMVRISVKSAAAARIAKRHGFIEVAPASGERKRVPPPTPAPATVSPSHPPAPEPAREEPGVHRVADLHRVDVRSMAKSDRKKLASKLKIKGRSKMSDDELVGAIKAALAAAE
jgi:hypothetical protein